MSAPVICALESWHLKEVRDIFFESSVRKNFNDENERDLFYQKYLGHYLLYYPEFAFVATIEDKVLGYVVSSPISATADLVLLQPHLQLFKRHFEKFPAHLHINCHHSARGLGVGTLLVEFTVQKLRQRNIKGLHIMTGPDSLNISFYRKLGFSFETKEEFQGSAILFMGKEIKADSL